MPMQEVRADTQIDASRQEVWSLLTDFITYPEWNPFIRELRGEAVEGRSLNLRLAGFGRRGASLWPRVAVANRPRELRLKAHLLPLGLLNGELRMRLSRNPDESTNFGQLIRFSGLLAPLLSERLSQRAQPLVEAFGSALKRRAENA